MNKYAYLEELEKRIGKLSQYQVDNIVNDYSVAISRMLDDYMDWEQIQKEIGTPKEAAKRVLDGKPMFIASDQRKAYSDDYYPPERQRREKKGMSALLKVYLILGLVTIPLTIALVAVVLSFMIAAVALIISGPAALVYSIVLGIVSASPLIFFTWCGASLILCAVGLFLLWAAKKLFLPVKAFFKAGKSRN